MSPTSAVDVLLARVPDARVEAAEQEAVVAGLPAVVHFAGVGVVGSVVDAVVAPLLAAARFGDALRALAPVRRGERRAREQQREQVQAHGEQRATPAARLHGARGIRRAGLMRGKGGTGDAERARASAFSDALKGRKGFKGDRTGARQGHGERARRSGRKREKLEMGVQQERAHI